mgnify:CR=1 FL=1|tara:strand:+ start:10270 stop:10479 length:210 start_codon:yes stop_codon:yes gene_type:complete
MEFLNVLTRNEMKSVKAGTGGNIHCSIDGNQFSCTGGSLIECTDACADIADLIGPGTYCGGCAQFPEME